MLLFVHGSCGYKEQYDLLLAEMEPWLIKNGIVAELFDAYGCGKSEKPRDYAAYSEQALQEDLAVMYSRVKHPRCNFIVAHSYGTSQVVKLLAAMAPEEREKVKGVVLISGTMPGRDGGHSIFTVLPSFVLNWLQPMLSSTFVKLAFAPDADQAIKAKSEKRSNENPMYMCKYFYNQTKWVTHEECQSLAPTTAKYLVVHGAVDQVLEIESARTLAASLPNASFIKVENAAHQVMEEKPAEVAERMTGFFDKLKG
jgi:abhydrolase domain-containing protein 8